jgi:hypothetical protein
LNLENSIDKNQKTRLPIQFHETCPILIKTQVKFKRGSKNTKKALKTKKMLNMRKKQNKIFYLSSLYHETHF